MFHSFSADSWTKKFSQLNSDTFENFLDNFSYVYGYGGILYKISLEVEGKHEEENERSRTEKAHQKSE